MSSSAIANGVVKFGHFTVTRQVFYKTSLSFALVNLMPLLPGHVLVCPLRQARRLGDLSTAETIDLFLTVQKVSKMISRVFKADSLNIAIQDGPMAGQSVPHLHCHIIPRKLKDLPNTDDIYRLLESDEADLDKVFYAKKAIYRSRLAATESTANSHHHIHTSEANPDRFTGPDVNFEKVERKPRSDQEMDKEAHKLREEMEKQQDIDELSLSS